MIQTLIHRLFLRRHFWRYATFSEVAELYASRMMRTFALRIVTTFTSIYLYQIGYELVYIAFFWAVFYGMKIPFSGLAALIAARLGPKHGTLISNIVSALGMIFLPLIPLYGLPALIAWSVCHAFANTLNDLCYLIDFSKVKNSTHAGKEIGYMNIIEKAATGVSPLIGGVLAFWWGPETVMGLSVILFLLAAVPLFKTAEPTLLHQRLHFRGFPWRTTWRSLVAEAAIGFDVYASGTAWSLFMVVLIFANNGDEVYAKIGAVSSITIIAALLASYVFGQLIDRRRGRELLIVSSLANALTHAFRPFVGSPALVVASNFVNEAATTGYVMAFTRGMFDTADLSGRRIVYLFFIEVASNFGAMLAGVAAGLLFMAFGDEIGLHGFFFVSAAVVLLIAAPRFMLYRK